MSDDALEETFAQEVESITREWGPTIARLSTQYSMPAIATAHTMHLVAALSVCVRDLTLTREQAIEVIRRLSAADPNKEVSAEDLALLIQAYQEHHRRRETAQDTQA